MCKAQTYCTKKSPEMVKYMENYAWKNSMSLVLN